MGGVGGRSRSDSAACHLVHDARGARHFIRGCRKRRLPLRAADADGHVLLASAIRRQEYTAELWTLDGDLVCQGDFGNALRHVLATTGGAIWVGYFDEALGGSGPQGHGVARFSSGLVPEWLYPIGSSLPPVFDCYALNVVGRDAYVQAYDEFHLVRVNGDDATDLGRVTRQGANRVLVDDNRAALIGGYGAEYDLITPIRLT